MRFACDSIMLVQQIAGKQSTDLVNLVQGKPPDVLLRNNS